MKVGPLASWICGLAFLMDAGTGLSLIIAPAFTLGLMGLDPVVAPLAYLRFIGAFVFAVGCLYGLAWRYLKEERWAEWSVLWVATGWVRLCVGTTVLVLLLTKQLDTAWSSVPLADLGLAIFQFSYLARARRNNG